MRWNTQRVAAAALVSIVAAASLLGVRQLGTMTLRVCEIPADSGSANPESEALVTDYVEARRSFLDAVRAVGGVTESIEHPELGPGGDPLFMDVASFGVQGAPDVLVLSSGTHGVEGFAGSGIQTRLIREGLKSRMPSGVGLLLIHGINPYGMANLRRANEDNVDLNRNFRDHGAKPPENSGYERLAAALEPASLSFWSEVTSWSRILWYRATAGKAAAAVAVTGGQYSHTRGLFFGGFAPAWSNTTLKSVVGRYPADSKRVIFVDFHTGLGDYGTAEVILNVPEDSNAFFRAVTIWGEATRSTVTGDSLSTHLEASLKLALPEVLPAAEVTAVSLEFGTAPSLEVVTALRAENCLHHYGARNHPRTENLKACLLRSFHPGTPDWESAILEQRRGGC